MDAQAMDQAVTGPVMGPVQATVVTVVETVVAEEAAAAGVVEAVDVCKTVDNVSCYLHSGH